MVRGDDHDVGGRARRARLTSRRRRRRRRRPLRRRRVRLTHRRSPSRLLRVPAETNTRLNRLQLSRDNIQLHPTISRSPASPAVVSYLPAGAQYVSKATGAVQFVTFPDYISNRVDSGSQGNPILIQLQKPVSSSSGLIDDIQVIGLADHKTTTSLNKRPEGNYATMTDGEVVVPVALRQSPSHLSSLSSQELVVPLQVSAHRLTA